GREHATQRGQVWGRVRRQELLARLLVELGRLTEIEVEIERGVDQRARSFADARDGRAQQRFIRVLDAALGQERLDPSHVLVERRQRRLLEVFEGHVGELLFVELAVALVDVIPRK